MPRRLNLTFPGFGGGGSSAPQQSEAQREAERVRSLSPDAASPRRVRGFRRGLIGGIFNTLPGGGAAPPTGTPTAGKTQLGQ